MLLSDEYNFAFIHVPKTGGSSVTAALAPYINSPRPLPTAEKPGWQKHHHVNAMHASYTQSRGLIRGHVTFACVRNPWARMWSIWRRLTATDRWGWKGWSLAAFLEQYARGGVDRAHFWAQRQTWWVRPTDPVTLLRFETLDRDWRSMCVAVGLPDLTLGRWNEKRARDGVSDWREAYTLETASRLRYLWRDDVAAFGYQTSGPFDGG